MPKFKGVDFYNTDSLLSEDERQIRDSVREWVDDNVIPIIEKSGQKPGALGHRPRVDGHP